MTILFLVAGLLFLVAGAEGLVRGASTLAERAGIPSLVVGLTVVAFGTSAPELAVSIGSSLGGQPDVAVGNVVGSNIFNVLFILGIAALVAPLTAASLALLGGLALVVPNPPTTVPEWVGLYLVFIAVVTLPHVVVVTIMDREQSIWT